MTNKRTCEYCGWHGLADEVLRARSPFDDEDELHGCPSCKSINTIVVACDEPDCWKPCDSGTPTPTGYRVTCSRHVPRGTFIALAALLLCCLASCTTTTPTGKPCQHISHASPAASCVAIDADQLDEPAPLEALFIWGHRSKFWPSGTTLKVRFLEGTAQQQAKAWQRFQVIDSLAGITFQRVCSGPSDIRVSFRPGAGHWSYVGKSCSEIPQNAPTMNLGLTTQDDSGEWDRVALHEILHALGFSHELQHPHASIPWDERRVIADYAATQGWSEAQTRRQVLTRDDGTDFVGSTFDAKSIMCYPVPREHVTDARYAAGWNVRMTDTDKRVLKEAYP